MPSDSSHSTPGRVVLFTGLPASGKSTLAARVFEALSRDGHRVELLDGDRMREHLGKDLGFTREERTENVRRIAFVANRLASHGVISLMAVIAPYRDLRAELRRNSLNFLEIFVNAPPSVCEARDPKGLYRRARAGAIRNFTGVDDAYEPPLSPDVECRTDQEEIDACVDKILNAILGKTSQCA